MHLKLVPGNKTHLSHFHPLVSAYETNDETIKDLEQSISDAIRKAKENTQPIIVDQDSIEHIFIVWPSGKISLYREVGCYEIFEEGF